MNMAVMHRQSKGEVCNIVEAYRPPLQEKYELELDVGNVVTVVVKEDSRWWGIKVRDSIAGASSAAFGWFPATRGSLLSSPKGTLF